MFAQLDASMIFDMNDALPTLHTSGYGVIVKTSPGHRGRHFLKGRQNIIFCKDIHLPYQEREMWK